MKRRHIWHIDHRIENEPNIVTALEKLREGATGSWLLVGHGPCRRISRGAR